MYAPTRTAHRCPLLQGDDMWMQRLEREQVAGAKGAAGMERRQAYLSGLLALAVAAVEEAHVGPPAQLKAACGLACWPSLADCAAPPCLPAAATQPCRR